jgi:DNA-binding response OmpR family regulator
VFGGVEYARSPCGRRSELAGYVRKGLEEEGYVVQVCVDGSAGLRAAEMTAFDLIVLDVMLPFLDGLEVAKRLRFQNIRTPILLLTARDAPEDIVRGLDAGADDYLTKPFSFDVLLARIRARTRSAGDRRLPVIRYADLSMDTAKHLRFLREKVDAAGKKKLIHTERGLGYVPRDY